ncbi:lysine-2,3-aminomutase-like protein [Acetobacter orleanensis]|uniref:Lysine 2,3-aminomutase n=1 Tax=Acetobacter orleanensis TaxID=104099 RepID=A0A4Y3TNP7_9PROT|nr:lysine-2,3-aminomutase-like protein [Acetobacter orleanensis]KXV66943.1 lysine 2,3-aminomutase [Acetobacter orleanensis]PCD78704.1 lysine 2,3-aminomutase [Acetobacter orleanensis]GAN67352.1 lysine 2,3-aminomutase [Acetobacter orleanensis JCM 7639]GBR23585.1 lysine 2,3-aminomutase [Acetobacter orleanensis NRIC 0473]GEB83363.1 lysine 2,3-aminomutase [Acetobacter orleanensis]
MSHPVNPPSPARRLLRTPEDLIAAGLAPPEQKAALDAVAQAYATAIPPAFLDLIEQPDDPIGVQVIPSPEELVVTPEERSDPIGDDALSPVPGIVHRYADRALLKPLLVCPLYCRFCFRREHVGPDGGVLDDAALETALDWLRTHPAIREVILTGGDPLMLSPRRLGHIITALSAIPHVTTIRLHTRVPVAAPERVTDAMLDVLETDKALWMAVHINHAREMSDAARACLKRLVRRGVPLLGQSVLLRGVNDSEQALEDLFRSMVEVRMRPYYLHQLDPAPGTARFHVPVEEGQRLLAGLRGRVTGLAWPTYVLDIPGGYGKVPLGPDYVDGALQVRDPEGRPHTLQRL